MTTQWNAKAIGAGGSGFDPKLLNEAFVILMQGKNTFGDRIYSYLKLTVKEFLNMQEAIRSGNPFNPSDFGSVVAAGKGEPPTEVRAEIESLYRVMNGGTGAVAEPVAAPQNQKAWDEY